jgi:hypothetical protein
MQQSDYEKLCTPTEYLFRVAVEAHARQLELKNKILGKSMDAGELRGVVTGIRGNQITIRGKNGNERSVTLTPQRLSQLLTTTRK